MPNHIVVIFTFDSMFHTKRRMAAVSRRRYGNTLVLVSEVVYSAVLFGFALSSLTGMLKTTQEAFPANLQCHIDRMHLSSVIVKVLEIYEV